MDWRGLLIHKSKAIAEQGWCIGEDGAYVYRYEHGTIRYLNNDGKRWGHMRDVGVSDEEADRQAAAWAVKEGPLPKVMRPTPRLDISFTCKGITFGGATIPIQIMKYALGQLVPFVYEPDGGMGIEVRSQFFMGVSGVLTKPSELDQIIKTWELVNEKKECTHCGIYLDNADTLCESCNRRQ